MSCVMFECEELSFFSKKTIALFVSSLLLDLHARSERHKEVLVFLVFYTKEFRMCSRDASHSLGLQARFIFE